LRLVIAPVCADFDWIRCCELVLCFLRVFVEPIGAGWDIRRSGVMAVVVGAKRARHRRVVVLSVLGRSHAEWLVRDVVGAGVVVRRVRTWSLQRRCELMVRGCGRLVARWRGPGMGGCVFRWVSSRFGRRR